MKQTFTCKLINPNSFEMTDEHTINSLSLKDFERHISRRQIAKISTITKMADVMFKYFSINKKIQLLGGDPQNTPLVICNRYANWDYVADEMSQNIENTLNNINSYVATAWFPATLQGFLTIEYSNKNEAITIATKDKELIGATIQAFLPERGGPLALCTFECLPQQIAGLKITDNAFAFGSISLITSKDSDGLISSIIDIHQGMYTDE